MKTMASIYGIARRKYPVPGPRLEKMPAPIKVAAVA
jgi:hypothetical protein